MQRGSDKHGGRVDEELKHEVEGMTRGAPAEPRVEELREMEGAADEPVADARLAGDRNLTPDGTLTPDAIEARSEIAKHLRGSAFPATSETLLQVAEEEQAEQWILGELATLPEGQTFANVQEVWNALGGPVEMSDDRHAPRLVKQLAEVGVDAEAEQGSEPQAKETAGTANRDGLAAARGAGPQLASPAAAAPSRRFAFAFDGRFRLPLIALGITPGNSHVEVAEGRLLIRFGPWRVETGLDNVEGAEVTGPYRWFRSVGPHLSFTDRGVTFGTNAEQGACLRFRTAVIGLDPFGLLRHPGVTVTVEDPQALLDAIEER